MLRTLKLILAYDGTEFSGWQRQPGRRTVQEVVESALRPLTGEPVAVTASGRTDAGVHALGQVAHFHTIARHPPEVFLKALNATLPPDVRVVWAEEAPQSFHATLDAQSKRYRYVIDNGPFADPFLRRTAWHLFRPLDAPRMNRAVQALRGRHDFRSFETNWPNRMSSVRTILDVQVRRVDHRVELEVEADGFLYNMVRSIAGTAVLVGLGDRPETFVAEVLHAQDRRLAGPTAPPQGLFLLQVRYGLRDRVARWAATANPQADSYHHPRSQTQHESVPIRR